MDGLATFDVGIIGRSITGALTTGSASELIGCCATHAVSIKNTPHKMAV
jgi:hypothetical protein